MSILALLTLGNGRHEMQLLMYFVSLEELHAPFCVNSLQFLTFKACESVLHPIKSTGRTEADLQNCICLIVSLAACRTLLILQQ